MAQYSKLTPKAYTCALPAQLKSNAKVLLGYGLVANADRNFTVAHALGIARNAEREKVESETENVPFAKILNPPARKHRYLQKMW